MIPKIIHYCWFGNGTLGALAQKCIATWKQNLPDYQIICWNEENIDLSDPYIKKCIKQKQWAFLSDRVRFDALYSHGGIYLDVDMEILKSLDEFLNYSFFIGRESKDWIAAGIIGSKPKNKICLQIAELINKSVLHEKKFTPVPQIITTLITETHKKYPCEVKILPESYFYPYNPYDTGRDASQLMAIDIKPETHAIHHWQKQWSTKKSITDRIKSKLLRKIRKVTIS